MVRLSILAFVAALSVGDAFVPSAPVQRTNAIASITTTNPSTTTSLDAAPTMFIYWSIKTAIDTIAYGLGATDKVKGTGVWNAFELSREPKEEEEEDAEN